MPLGFLRVLLGALCVLFAHSFGRSVLRFRQGRERRSRTITWALRSGVTGAAVVFRVGFDVVTIAVCTLALLSFGAGVYLEWRPKHHEDLERVMFPRE